MTTVIKNGTVYQNGRLIKADVLIEDQKIKELLDSHIQKEFTDTSIVAEYIYDAGQVNFDDNLERYLSRYEQDYMMQYGLDLSNIEHLGQAGYLNTSSFINQLLSVKEKWPN